MGRGDSGFANTTPSPFDIEIHVRMGLGFPSSSQQLPNLWRPGPRQGVPLPGTVTGIWEEELKVSLEY